MKCSFVVSYCNGCVMLGVLWYPQVIQLPFTSLTDNDVQMISPTATMATLRCSLNTTIPSTVSVRWFYNNENPITGSITGNTARIQIQNPTAGNYQCVFIDTFDGWSIRRNIRLVIAGTSKSK